ncbi:hypothetical protein VTK26DRAFT_3299 [Humicola hyalothermophila]
MPAATRARALLSARTSCRNSGLPRVAAVHANAAAAASTIRGVRTGLARHELAIAARPFHISLPLLGRSDDPNHTDESRAEEAKKKDNGAVPDSGQPAETPGSNNGAASAAAAAEAKKEKLRSLGYGSARARASRSRADEMPVIELPAWFMNDNVSLYESRPIGSPSTLLFPLEGEDRENVLELLDSYFDRAALTEGYVEELKDKMRNIGSGPGGFDAFKKLLRRVRGVHHAAFFQALVLVHHHDAEHDHIERLRQHHSSKPNALVRPSWWPGEELSGDAQRWLANIRPDLVHGSGALHGSPLANRPDPEYPVCMELLAAVRSQLSASVPVDNRHESRRPVTVLSVLNRKGRTVARSVINDIATDLRADVVHLDAQSIASLVGRHLGQNPYSARGSLCMLGYAAAEMNGRLAPRPDADSENEMGMVAVALPSRLRSFLSSKDSILSGVTDGRWEDMKIAAALDTLIAAADIKRGVTQKGLAATEENPLLIHVHDYVELNSLHPGIINKLRTIADRMWMAGRKVALVGSSSGDLNRSSQWRDQLIEIGRDGSGHVIPFHASETSEWMENYDNFNDNLSNIEAMLRAVLGPKAEITFRKEIRFEEGRILVDGKYDKLVETLSSHLYDAQWVYRLTSLMVGGRTPQLKHCGLPYLRYALGFMSDRNKHWSSIYPSVRPPYFSPLTPSRSSSTSFLSSGPEDWSSPTASPSNLSGGPTSSKEYDQHEKKLLSGLINAKDIRTTFNDIIVPQETKDSLIGLTSLSLIRPEAFSYGVLKTERIPGCLLYGPPGTGKTLLAKAVAKESGANMLEVSAASINDMWLGQSEKNVRALFSLARKLSPCVIFLDEADALLGARHNGPGRSGHRETITQFLREWDGLTSDMRAFIMVATNRPFDLDEAVLRRLPRKILVDLPLRAEREAILRVMLRDETLADDVDLAKMAAEETELYSGSDLKNLCVSAAMQAVREEVRAKEEHEARRKASMARAATENEGIGGEQQEQQKQQQQQLWEGEEEEEVEEEEYRFPERRVLRRRHFEKGLREISASISEDMDSLKAIRKFDEQYGDAGRRRRGKRSMGFEVVPGTVGTEEARVRQVGSGAGGV